MANGEINCFLTCQVSSVFFLLDERWMFVRFSLLLTCGRTLIKDAQLITKECCALQNVHEVPRFAQFINTNAADFEMFLGK